MSAMNFLYKNVLKPILFRIHPDHVHDVFVAAGTDLIQMVSDMIFGGPGIMKEICKHYAKRIPAVAGSSGMAAITAESLPRSKERQRLPQAF